MLKLSRKFLLAGVLGLGLAACGDDVTVTEPPPPPPPPETPNITTFSVSPASATIAPNTFVQASYTLITKTGVTGTVSWESSNGAVATVDGNGRIDAMSEGTAVITATATAGGQTATGLIGITVRPIQPAQVSIKSVTQGLTTLPVNISNVFGQIEITLNFDPGEQVVDSVAVFIGNERAAKQAYATSPSAGDIVLSVNTANFHEDYATGTAPVDYENGATTISAAVYPRGAAATATNTIQIVLNNADGWSADMTAPSRANNNVGSGLTYWGGPADSGFTEVTLYPVIYTPGRSIKSVFIGNGGCTTPTALTALPFRQTFGYGAAGADVNCAGYEWTGGARNNATATGAIDNTNNAYPSTPTIANTVVLGSTPDSLRFDWKAPSVSTPGIGRTAPAVTGWVNASFPFAAGASDGGVGTDGSTQLFFYNAPNCGGASAVAMPTASGADIPECATNAIGGGPGLGGTAPYTVYSTEADLLSNLGTSGKTQTFGVDKTAPSIRWGLDDDAYAAKVVVVADSEFITKPVAADEYRVEYLDTGVAPSGFYNAGAPSGGVAAQSQSLAIANHSNNTGTCVVGDMPTAPGANFVTAQACDLTDITTGGLLRLDGWQGGESFTMPDGEAYYGYASAVWDAAGNSSDTLSRKSFVNANDPFATGLTVPGTIDATTMAFGPTFADSVEVVRQSLQVTYPDLGNASLGLAAGADSVRYSRSAIGAVFDDAITSPYLSSISPNTGAPYVRHLEAVTATAFANPVVPDLQAAPAGTKPVNVVAWSWNPGGINANAPTPNPGRSSIIAIPDLLVQDGVNFINFTYGPDGVPGGGDDNVTNAVIFFRVIATTATTNQFGSTAVLRAQAVSPTNTPNAPFARVDFYRQVTVGPDTWLSYLGSSSSPIPTDQGTYRSWLYAAPGTPVNAWDGSTAQAAVAAGDVIVAVGVTAAGDGLAASETMTL